MRCAFFLALLAPALVQAAGLQHYEPWTDKVGEAGGLPVEFARWDQRLLADGEDGAQESVGFELVAEVATAPPERIVVFVIDLARDDRCEGAFRVGRVFEDVEVEIGPAPEGWEHLGRAATCSLVVPSSLRLPGAHLTGEATLHHGAMEPFGDRRLLYVPLLPLAAPARVASLTVDWNFADGMDSRVVGFPGEIRPAVLPKGRRRLVLRADQVAAPPSVLGLRTLIGRAAGVLLRSGEDWNELSRLHRDPWERAMRLTPSLVPLAARVLAQPSAEAAVQEAARIVLDGLPAPEASSGGALFRLPEGLDDAVAVGKADVPTRAAILVTLLRAADLRAEVVFASSLERPNVEDVSWAFLDRVLVAVPDLRDAGGEPLFIDPSLSAAELGVLRPGLSGGEGLAWGPHGARFVPITGMPSQAVWTLEGVEQPERKVRVHLSGRLTGPAAGEFLRWQAKGMPADQRPDRWMAWLSAPAWAECRPSVRQDGFGGAIVELDTLLPRDAVVEQGRTVAPALPWPTLPSAKARVWPYEIEALRLSFDESWTFTTLSGQGNEAPAPQESHVGTAELAWSWQGAVLKRRVRVDREGGTVTVSAAPQVEALRSFVLSAWAR